MLEDVVDVAGDLARRAGADGDLQALDRRRFAQQQDGLHVARGLEVLLHALLALCQFFVQPRVFHRTGDLRRQQRQQPRVVLGEVADALALQIHDADDAILHDQRHGDFGADVGMRGDVARDRPACRPRARSRAIRRPRR